MLLYFNILIFRSLPELEKPCVWISAVGLSTFGVVKTSMRSTVWVVRPSVNSIISIGLDWSTRAEKNVTESYVWLLNCSLVWCCILWIDLHGLYRTTSIVCSVIRPSVIISFPYCPCGRYIRPSYE